MSLLHAIQETGNRTAAWELSSLASALGLPAPPELKLPDLPAVVGACDFTALAASLGQATADALKAQFADSTVRTLMTDDLQAKRDTLLNYLGGLDTQKAALLAQLTASSGAGDLLAAGQDTLSGVRAALGGAASSPVGSEVMKTLAAACPAAAGLVSYAESALDTLSADLGGVQSYAAELAGHIDGLTDLRAKGEGLLAEIDAHLEILPALFTSLGGTNG